MKKLTFTFQHDQSHDSKQRKRAQTMAYTLRNERHLRRLRGTSTTRRDAESANKENVYVQLKASLDDALKNDLAVLSEVTSAQNTNHKNANIDDSSDFALCNELLNEMVLRQQDLNSLHQDTNTHAMHQGMIGSIQARHITAMQKLQGMIGSENGRNKRALSTTIQDNNQKWLKYIQRHTNGEESKSRSTQKQKKTVHKELEAMYLVAEIELNAGADAYESNQESEIENPMLLLDAMEAKYNRKCLEYDELHAEYTKLKAECALQSMFENEYKKLLNEMMGLRKLNEKQNDEHKQKCKEYDGLMNKYDKANDRAERLQAMYQSEYEKVVQELVTFRQKHDGIQKEYGVLSKLMDATKEENECLMQQLSESKQVKDIHVKLKGIENETLKEEYERVVNELNETKSNQKHRMQQLEELYQAEYSKLVTEFNEYKNNNPQIKEMHRKEQNDNDIQQMYQAEYEKLLNDFTQYKQAHPPN